MPDGRYLLPEFEVKPDGNRCRLQRERLVEHMRKLLKQGRMVRDVAAGMNLPKSTVRDIASQGQKCPSKPTGVREGQRCPNSF